MLCFKVGSEGEKRGLQPEEVEGEGKVWFFALGVAFIFKNSEGNGNYRKTVKDNVTKREGNY